MDDFADFFAATRNGVFRVVFAATGTRTGAEDAVAEAYTRAYSRWDSVRNHPNPTAWVLRTALNVHRSVWRRLRREVLAGEPPEPLSPGGDGPAPPLDRRVRAAVRALPRRQREVVALRLLADLSADETGAVLGVAPATVHVHLHRALGTLRTSLDPGGGDSGAGTARVPRPRPTRPRTPRGPEPSEFRILRAVRHAF
jgi:RNA polymerase sigma factor (sigma-70 family)